MPGVAARCVANRPDVIFHLAAVVSGEAEADFDKGYRVNLDGARALFEAIRAVGDGYRPRVVFTSSTSTAVSARAWGVPMTCEPVSTSSSTSSRSLTPPATPDDDNEADAVALLHYALEEIVPMDAQILEGDRNHAHALVVTLVIVFVATETAHGEVRSPHRASAGQRHVLADHTEVTVRAAAILSGADRPVTAAANDATGDAASVRAAIRRINEVVRKMSRRDGPGMEGTARG